MKTNMRLRFIYLLSLSLFISVGLSSCYGEKEKALEGTWYQKVEDDGFYGINEYRFYCEEEKNTFTQKIIPLSDDGIGFQVDGTWKIDWRGDLVMRYHTNTLELLTNQEMAEWDLKTAESEFKMQLAVLNAEAKEGAAIPFERNDDVLVMTTQDGKERFTWSEESFEDEE